MRTFENTESALKFITEELLWGAAAGTCKDPKTAKKYAQAGMKIVSYGSETKLAQAGNAGDNFYCDEVTGDSINALGIPNKGVAVHHEELPGVRNDVNG